MKMLLTVAIATACALPAQSPATKPVTKPANATASAAAHATLADLQRDFQQKKFAALDVYAKLHATAKDAPDAIVEAVGLAKELNQPEHVLRLVEQYLKSHADGSAAMQMRMARGDALRDKGDVAGAQQAFEQIAAEAGDDVNSFVKATTALADLLVSAGKKDEGIKVLTDAAEARSEVRGLKQHFEKTADGYKLIGTEPLAMGQEDTTGKPIDLAEYKGKVLLIDFWATWCGPCIAELPSVLAAYEKFHDKGFEILGISLDKESDRAAFDKFVADRQMTWRHHFDGLYWKNEIAVAYGVKSIPATYLVGPDGKIVAVGLRGDRLEKELQRLLGDKSSAKPAKGE